MKIQKMLPSCDVNTEDSEMTATMRRLEETERALHDLEALGLVRSRINPISGMREWRITKKGIRHTERTGG
jgi:hypothetical protein